MVPGWLERQKIEIYSNNLDYSFYWVKNGYKHALGYFGDESIFIFSNVYRFSGFSFIFFVIFQSVLKKKIFLFILFFVSITHVLKHLFILFVYNSWIKIICLNKWRANWTNWDKSTLFWFIFFLNMKFYLFHNTLCKFVNKFFDNSL